MTQALLLHPILAPALVALLGAILGSFGGALVARWPEERSVLAGRSQCASCERTLGPLELVPILSWLWLRGRCRACGAAIGADALAIEAIAAAIGAVAMIVQPGWSGLALAVFGWLLLPLAWLDFRHFWLPDGLTVALGVMGLATGLAGHPPPLADRLIGGVAGFAMLWLVATAYRQSRRREGLGGGDPKLFGAIGLWLGWQGLPLVLLWAAGLGLLTALAGRISGRPIDSGTKMPFGTLLALAAWPIALISAAMA